jgi:hypothetical protein
MTGDRLLARRPRKGGNDILCGILHCDQVIGKRVAVSAMADDGSWREVCRFVVLGTFAKHQDGLGVFYRERPFIKDARRIDDPYHRRPTRPGGTRPRGWTPEENARDYLSSEELPVRVYCPKHPDQASWVTPDLLTAD